MLQALKNVAEKDRVLGVGLMSGTSLDGIDAALVEITKGQKGVKLLEFHTTSYSQEEKQALLQLCHPETSTVDRICRQNVRLGHKFAEAARAVCEQNGRSIKDVDFVSSHGQTIYHMPEDQATFQIGELAVIAEQTGCLTVGDFRPSDMAVGGQGAPLVPYADKLLFRDASIGRILVNIGGISNLSVVEAEGGQDVLAMDTGPGNVLIDSVVQLGAGKPFDEGGKIAATGNIQTEWLQEMVDQDEYLKQGLPKTTGREFYTWEKAKRLFEEGESRGYSFEDMVATVTAFTATAIVTHIKRFVDPHYQTEEVLIAGGGVHNQTLLALIQQELSQQVKPLDELNFSSDAKEAITFALLGYEFLNGRPNQVPSATGANKEVSMGKLALPSSLIGESL